MSKKPSTSRPQTCPQLQCLWYFPFSGPIQLQLVKRETGHNGIDRAGALQATDTHCSHSSEKGTTISGASRTRVESA